MLYENVDQIVVREIKQQISFIIVTATQIETTQLHKLLKPLQNKSKLIRVTKDDYTYTIGFLGKYVIVHVQCEMGSIGIKSSMATCSVSYKLWKPKAIIMVGIAFGADKRKQDIGDILISSAIIPYEKERVGKNGRISRAKPLNPGSILLDRISNNQICNFKIASKTGLNARKPKLKVGDILSGEKLIDNKEFKINLLAIQPEAIGGEMEGAGLASFANSHQVEWILIKGICDYADGKKNVNKDSYQKIAAESASKYLLQLFLNDKIFEDLGIKATKINSVIQTKNSSNLIIGDVLFEIYSKEHKKNYILRAADNIIIKKMKHYSLWLSGDTGIGKTTAAIKYSLDQKNIEFIVVGLANSLTSTPLGLFTEFYNQLCLKFSIEISIKKFKSLTEAYNTIYSLLSDKLGTKQCIILIDEIPVFGKLIKPFVNCIYGMIVHIKTHFNNLDLRLIISTFFEPTCHLAAGQQKINEHVKFFHLEKWPVKDVRRLIRLITQKLLLIISKDENTLLLEKANGSPRFIKKVFRDYKRNKEDQQYTLKRIIEESAEELNYGK